MKRVFTLILTMAIILGAAFVPATADQNALTFVVAECNADKDVSREVSVPISVTKNYAPNNLAGVTIDITIDTSKLEWNVTGTYNPANNTAGRATWPFHFNDALLGTPMVRPQASELQTDTLRFSLADIYAEAGDGLLVTMKLRVKSEATGFAAVTANVVAAGSNVGAITEYSVVQGGVRIFPIAAANPTVTGIVKSYNAGNVTTLVLKQGASEKYRTTIERANGSAQVTQSFAFADVAPGSYTLVATKPGHTSFTVQNITVGTANVDLTQDRRPEVRAMTLLCGDINGDGMINDGDLTVLWRTDNYNKNAASANNPLCDLNGDGMVNDGDLTVLWRTDHYNKGAVAIQ